MDSKSNSSPPPTAITPSKQSKNSRLFARLAHHNAGKADNSNASVWKQHQNSKKMFVSSLGSIPSTSSLATDAQHIATNNDSVLLKLCRLVKLFVLKKMLRKWSQLATELAMKEVIPQKLKHAGRIRQLSKNLDTTEQDIASTLMMANEMVDGFNEFSNIMRTIDFNTLDDLTKQQNDFDDISLTSYGNHNIKEGKTRSSSSRARYYVDSIDDIEQEELQQVETKKNNALLKASEDFDFLNGDISDILSVSSIIKNDIKYNNGTGHGSAPNPKNRSANKNKTAAVTMTAAGTPPKTNMQVLHSTEESVLHFEERLKSANKKIKSLENMYLYNTDSSTREDMSMVSQSEKELESVRADYDALQSQMELSIQDAYWALKAEEKAMAKVKEVEAKNGMLKDLARKHELRIQHLSNELKLLENKQPDFNQEIESLKKQLILKEQQHINNVYEIKAKHEEDIKSIHGVKEEIENKWLESMTEMNEKVAQHEKELQQVRQESENRFKFLTKLQNDSNKTLDAEHSSLKQSQLEMLVQVQEEKLSMFQQLEQDYERRERKHEEAMKALKNLIGDEKLKKKFVESMKQVGYDKDGEEFDDEDVASSSPSPVAEGGSTSSISRRVSSGISEATLELQHLLEEEDLEEENRRSRGHRLNSDGCSSSEERQEEEEMEEVEEEKVIVSERKNNSVSELCAQANETTEEPTASTSLVSIAKFIQETEEERTLKLVNHLKRLSIKILLNHKQLHPLRVAFEHWIKYSDFVREVLNASYSMSQATSPMKALSPIGGSKVITGFVRTVDFESEVKKLTTKIEELESELASSEATKKEMIASIEHSTISSTEQVASLKHELATTWIELSAAKEETKKIEVLLKEASKGSELEKSALELQLREITQNSQFLLQSKEKEWENQKEESQLKLKRFEEKYELLQQEMKEKEQHVVSLNTKLTASFDQEKELQLLVEAMRGSKDDQSSHLAEMQKELDAVQELNQALKLENEDMTSALLEKQNDLLRLKQETETEKQQQEQEHQVALESKAKEYEAKLAKLKEVNVSKIKAYEETEESLQQEIDESLEKIKSLELALETNREESKQKMNEKMKEWEGKISAKDLKYSSVLANKTSELTKIKAEHAELSSSLDSQIKSKDIEMLKIKNQMQEMELNHQVEIGENLNELKKVNKSLDEVSNERETLTLEVKRLSKKLKIVENESEQYKEQAENEYQAQLKIKELNKQLSLAQQRSVEASKQAVELQQSLQDSEASYELLNASKLALETALSELTVDMAQKQAEQEASVEAEVNLKVERLVKEKQKEMELNFQENLQISTQKLQENFRNDLLKMKEEVREEIKAEYEAEAAATAMLNSSQVEKKYVAELKNKIVALELEVNSANSTIAILKDELSAEKVDGSGVGMSVDDAMRLTRKGSLNAKRNLFESMAAKSNNQSHGGGSPKRRSSISPKLRSHSGDSSASGTSLSALGRLRSNSNQSIESNEGIGDSYEAMRGSSASAKPASKRTSFMSTTNAGWAKITQSSTKVNHNQYLGASSLTNSQLPTMNRVNRSASMNEDLIRHATTSGDKTTSSQQSSLATLAFPSVDWEAQTMPPSPPKKSLSEAQTSPENMPEVNDSDTSSSKLTNPPLPRTSVSPSRPARTPPKAPSSEVPAGDTGTTSRAGGVSPPRPSREPPKPVPSSTEAKSTTPALPPRPITPPPSKPPSANQKSPVELPPPPPTP